MHTRYESNSRPSGGAAGGLPGGSRQNGTRGHTTRNTTTIGVQKTQSYSQEPTKSLASSSQAGRRKSKNPDEVAWLIANLKETITQQNDVIKNARTDIESEQQNLKDQNTELREEIQSLRTELSAYSASLLPTRSWASVAESGASRPPPKQ